MFALLWMALWNLASAQETQIRLDIEKYQLANGLTVLLYEDHTTPAFSYQQWFKVGSVYEKPGQTGLAHFFEHLMFKGTTKYPEHQFERLLQARGGSFNAFTTTDYTGYYTNLPAGQLELIVDLESDRMRNLRFDPEAIKSEREVVKEERRNKFENEISGLLQEALFKTLYKVHGYSGTTIGSMKDLNAASIEDLKAFYNTYYAPNNAVVVVAGDFKKSEAKRLIEKYYGAIPSQIIPALAVSPEPEQKSPRAVTMERQVQNVTMTVAYPISKAGDPDTFALDLLANVLGEGPSSRLFKKMVYQQQAASGVQTSSWTPKYPGIFQVYVSLKPGADANAAIKTVMSEMHKVRENLVTDAELEKAKNQVMMSFVDALKTNVGKARALEINEVIRGDYRELFTDLDHYKSVTKEQIQAVAKKYLIPQRHSLIQVIPKQ